MSELQVGIVSAGDHVVNRREEGGTEWRTLSQEAWLWECGRERIRGSEGGED